jgi:predicted Co/Zn/Cd cation transporter (cation efflux family)
MDSTPVPTAVRAYALFIAFTALGVGFGLIIACSFLADESRRYLAGGGLALVALGGAGLFLLKGRQARTSVKSWTGPAAVAFVLGGPIIVGLCIFAFLHL